MFLDRDGTINSDEGHYYVYRPNDFVLNREVVEGLRLLQDKGFLLIVVTNQGGVAKGIYTESDVEIVHKYMCRILEDKGVLLHGIYYCPHHESVIDCDCRKPSPGMIDRAIRDLNLDRNRCYLIGDSSRDIEAAKAAQIKGFKIEPNASIVPICKKIIAYED